MNEIAFLTDDELKNIIDGCVDGVYPTTQETSMANELMTTRAKIKELESDKYINEIKAQGIEDFIGIETDKSIKAGNSEIFRSYAMVRRRLCVFLNKLRVNHD